MAELTQEGVGNSNVHPRAVTKCMVQAVVADDWSQELWELLAAQPWDPSMASSHQHPCTSCLVICYLQRMPQGELLPLELTCKGCWTVTGTEVPALPATAQQCPGQCWCLVTHFPGHEQWRQSTAMGMHCSVPSSPPSTGT